jgi:hypothetical protein
MVAEIHRVLAPGGEAILMLYNRYSWLNALSKLMKTKLEHEDAPVFNKYSRREMKNLLRRFSRVRIIAERFPVATRLHHGWKAAVYNQGFVRAFHLLPRRWVRASGWHLMAFAVK